MNWIKSFVIEYNLCPFANAPVKKDTLRIQVSNQQKKALALSDVMEEIFFLEQNPTIETSLLVFHQGFKDFFSYLDLIELAEDLLNESGYTGIYQIASFHPDYYFADSDPNDVANYSNRSPYPMIHLLREELLEKAIAVHQDTDKIPEHNIIMLRKLGLENIKKILDDCQPATK